MRAESRRFRRGLGAVSRFMLIHRAQSEQAEQRVIESARSRESLQQAKIEARLTLETHMAGFRPSPWLRQLLLKHWASYIVLLLLRYGAVESLPARRCLRRYAAQGRARFEQSNLCRKLSRPAKASWKPCSARAWPPSLTPTMKFSGCARSWISFTRVFRRLVFPGPATRRNAPSWTSGAQTGGVGSTVMRHLRGLRTGTWFELGKADADAGADAEAERGGCAGSARSAASWMLVNWAGAEDRRHAAGEVRRGYRAWTGPR